MSDEAAEPMCEPDGLPSFAPGDLLVAVNDVAQPVDFRTGIAGQGRYWHCDAFLQKKAEFPTGANGLIIGLAWDDARRIIFATFPRLSRIMAFDASGRPQSAIFPPPRRYGNIVQHASGHLIAGIHVNEPERAGTDDGRLVRFNPIGGGGESFDVAIDGGRGGRHGVSGLAVGRAAPDIVHYVSEAGLRLSRYDIGARRQLTDFHVFADGDARTYGLAVRDNGEVVMATGNGAVRFDPEGRLMQTYAVPTPRGWTRAALSADNRHFYLGNFMEGHLHRRDIETGDIVARLDVGLRGALTAALEIPPAC